MADRLRILCEMARGLDEIHSVAEMVHGDVKPDNILLSQHDPPIVR